MKPAAIPSILATAARYTALRRVGEGSYIGACPYPDHREPEAVFRVDVRSGYCLCAGSRKNDGSPRGGCGRGGDAVSLIEGVEGVSRAEAEAMLEELVGGAGTEQRARARRAVEWTSRYAQRWLVEGKAPDAEQARRYLDSRGFGMDVLQAYGVGYIPRQGVAQAARKRGAEYEDLIAGGVLSSAGKEMFAGRIVFPLRDVLGRAVGFGGRVLPGAPSRARYLNSPRTELFRKGDLLYGLDLALPAIRRERRAVVVSGYTDVLALHQAGISTAVAVLGSALNEARVRALSPYADELMVVVGPGDAGMEIALEAADLPVPRGLKLSAVVLDADLSDYADAHGEAELREALANPAPVPVAVAQARARSASGTRVGVAWRALEAFAGKRLDAEP